MNFELLEQARPLRPDGPPERSHAHYFNVLAILRDRGVEGILATDLYNCPEKYGRSPRNRISELRRDGHLISGKWEGKDAFRYVLLRENPDPKPKRAQRIRTEQRPLADDWYEQKTGHARPTITPAKQSQVVGPLFCPLGDRRQ